MENDVKDTALEKALLAGVELATADLQAISGGISDGAEEALKELKAIREELLHKAAQAAREGRSDAASAYCDAIEIIAKHEDEK